MSLHDIPDDFRDGYGDTNMELTAKVDTDTQLQFEIDLQETFEEAYELLLKKHHDYGPTNISDSPGGPLNGLLVRMWDKFARIRNLHEKGVDPANETVRDTYLDIANYAVIALMVIDEKWPGR